MKTIEHIQQFYSLQQFFIYHFSIGIYPVHTLMIDRDIKAQLQKLSKNQKSNKKIYIPLHRINFCN